jgi:hypothetical protein
MEAGPLMHVHINVENEMIRMNQKSPMSEGFAREARQQSISCDFLSPTRPSEGDDEIHRSSIVANMGPKMAHE